MDQLLRKYYAAYRQDHQEQRAKLMEAIANTGIVRRVDFQAAESRSLAFRVRSIIAAAAVLMILCGSIFLLTGGPSSVKVDTAWASAVAQAERLQSVYLMVSTYGSGQAAPQSVEMWWRRPNDFRMVFAQSGLIVTGNQQERRHYMPANHTLTISKAGEPGLEMAILGEFGDLFGSKQSLTQGWVHSSTLIYKEKMNYKGESCYRLTFEKGTRQYECIVNEKGSLIYEAKIFDSRQPEKILQKIEILSIDTEMPDSLFTINPQADDIIKSKLEAGATK
jgi:outer membrane lipoprotein-sorting protein